MDGWKYIEQILERLKTIDPYLILLFGSYAYGQPNEDSDIDILVVTNDDFMPQSYSDLHEYRIKVRRLIRDIAMEFPVDLIIFTKPMFKRFIELGSSFSKEILSKGKKLYESNNQRMAEIF